MKKLLFILLFIICFSACSAEVDSTVTPSILETTQSPQVSVPPAVSASPSATVSLQPTEPQASPSATASPAPSETPLETVSPSASPEPPSAEPTAESEFVSEAPYDDYALEIVGVDGESYYFTISELKDMSEGVFEADYFSLGKDPAQDTNHFKGVRLSYLISYLGLDEGAKKLSVKASDGYGASFSIREVGDVYIDETEPGKELYMILAWEQDGVDFGSLRLVRGQSIEGEFNRTFWVRDVVKIEVRG